MHAGKISSGNAAAPNRLAIILKDYPYKRGEPYFHRELRTLAQHFDEIVLFSRHNCTENEQFHFEVPEGVKVVNIGVHPNWQSKLRTVFSALFSNAFKRVLTDLRWGKVPMNWLTVKTALAYDGLAKLHAEAISSVLERMGRKHQDFIWYSYWCDEAAYMLAKWRHEKRIPFAISRLHSFDIYVSRHPFSYLPYRQFIAENLNAVICISEHGRQYLQSRHPTAQDFFQVNYLGVENEIYMAADARQPLKLLSLSNIVPIKNLEAIVQALAHWKGGPVHWHHFGGGKDDPYELRIRQLAKDKLGKLDNVSFTFHGFISPALVLNKIRELKPHALINSSHFEGIPVSMMEVASLGIPIIGPHICGVPEIVIDGENGFTFQPINSEQLLEKLVKFSRLNDEKYEAMCRKSLEIQRERFCAETNYQAFAQFLFSQGRNVIRR